MKSRHSSSDIWRGGDRKSTRLNSSHGYISYAVFCLKKKKSTEAVSDAVAGTTRTQTTDKRAESPPKQLYTCDCAPYTERCLHPIETPSTTHHSASS